MQLDDPLSCYSLSLSPCAFDKHSWDCSFAAGRVKDGLAADRPGQSAGEQRTFTLVLTFVFVLQVSLGEREQTDLHGQDADLSTAATAGTQRVAMRQCYILCVDICVKTICLCVFSSIQIWIIRNSSDGKVSSAWKEDSSNVCALLDFYHRGWELVRLLFHSLKTKNCHRYAK